MRYLLLSLSIPLFLLSCQSTNTDSIQPPEASDLIIKEVGWVLESYEADFFDPPLDSDTIYIKWSFLTSGSYEDLESVEVSDGVSQWTMTKDDIIWTTKKDGFIFNKRFMSKKEGNKQGDTLRVGDYILTFYFSNGSFYRKIFHMPIPGSTSSNHYQFVTTEKQLLNNPDYAPMLAMPEEVTVKKDTQEQTFNLRFTINSPLVRNGFVIIYDKDKKELASIGLKAPFNIEGKLNYFKYPYAPILDRAAYITINLVDGYQYEQPNHYDAKATSRYYTIQTSH
ncbi:hypothetical protein [Spirochaeta cellobiosiphila]|uniref:hypothetical protein n=1 Tax=Spirochaeta cellobiosiphila TaxID=504483 RepID=UPI000415F9E3|nr:hypothetical protein [Spirochaeta cellobiosiphila]